MVETRNDYKIFVGLSGKWPLGRPKRIWEDNVDLDLRKTGCDARAWMKLTWPICD
jgi:hypothetical protein